MAADQEQALVAACAAARGIHPQIVLDPANFGRALDERGLDAAALGPARAADLWVCAAALAGNAQAVEWFEREALPELLPALARLRLDGAEQDDTLQRFKEELFVGRSGARPKLHEYGGRGDLRGWLRVSLVRLGLKMLRSRREGEDDALLEQHAVEGDPELLLAKAEARALFRSAFQSALDALETRERLILKQHFVDGLSIDELGTLHRVHRATAARHVQSARKHLVDRLQKQLMADAGISRAECDRVLAFVQSQLGATLRRRLGSA
jgi:RNA polymerase sigma-70 factor, ECF subfamily